MKEKLDFNLNGKPVNLEAEGGMRPRTDLRLTGTKCGGGEGSCGGRHDPLYYLRVMFYK